MHANPRKIAPIILAVLVLAALVYWFISTRPANSTDQEISASGTIEITQVQVGPELAGRAVEVAVSEGERVKAGDVLVRFDDSLLQEQRKQAEAALAAATFQQSAAESNLALLKAGPSAEQLAVAEAAVNQARVAADAARSAYDDLPDAWKDKTDGKAALAKADAADAALQSARAQYDLVKAGARPEQIQAARDQADAAAAQVQAARAALAVLDVQINKLAISAPADGVVMTLSIQPGEFATPGSTLLVLGREAEKTITVYVPEEVYGRISLGQAAGVSVDSFPGQSFEAAVIHIADQAEFTPRNVQTAQGRKNTVFAIKLQVTDPENRLKAGMPADVLFK